VPGLTAKEAGFWEMLERGWILEDVGKAKTPKFNELAPKKMVVEKLLFGVGKITFQGLC